MLADVFNTTTDYLLGREIVIRSEIDKEYLGNISKDDVDIIKELKNNTKLYEKLIKDCKRYISLIYKKML